MRSGGKCRMPCSLFSGMAGVLTAARAIADPQGQERMLAAARSFYVETFASDKAG